MKMGKTKERTEKGGEEQRHRERGVRRGERRGRKEEREGSEEKNENPTNVSIIEIKCIQSPLFDPHHGVRGQAPLVLALPSDMIDQRLEIDQGQKSVKQSCYWYAHHQVLLHHNHLYCPPHPLLLLQPIGDGPAHHSPSNNHNIGPLWWEIGVDLQRSPAAPRQSVHRLLSHRRQLLLQI